MKYDMNDDATLLCLHVSPPHYYTTVSHVPCRRTIAIAMMDDSEYEIMVTLV